MERMARIPLMAGMVAGNLVVADAVAGRPARDLDAVAEDALALALRIEDAWRNRRLFADRPAGGGVAPSSHTTTRVLREG